MEMTSNRIPRFEIVAHRGVATDAPENTIAAFERAAELGADAVELDVRLTSDHVPVVYHYYYLENNSSTSGVIFGFTWKQLQEVEVRSKTNPAAVGRISTLAEILEMFGGRIGLEIDMKGPEPEAPLIIGEILRKHKGIWRSLEVTSYDPALLLSIRRECPGLATDLLMPRSEAWMKPDVVEHEAIQYARLARARAVHLHPSQLSPTLVEAVRQHGFEIHAWNVNDESSLGIVADLGIPRLDTDNLRQALAFRARL
jgi:glycerophosphoryl diester phosphodiesterase